MNDIHSEASPRLDSWKAIAAYLDRDERTAQRWERELGLPVRRVPGGRGRSVFAYRSEIDEWLRTTGPGETAPVAATSGAPVPALTRRRPLRPTSTAVVAALVIVTALVWRLRPGAAAEPHLHLAVTTDSVVAFDASGARRWTYSFSPAYTTYLAEAMSDPSYVATAGSPAIYVATAFRDRHADGIQEGGTLTELDLSGTPRRSFAFDDEVTFAGTTYGPPWVISDFAVYDSGGARRIAITAHHAVWSASLVTVLDGQMHRHGTFVHAGWVEQVRWMAANRLVIGGYSNAHEGGMVALLDPTRPDGIDGQGPEPATSRYYCSSCSSTPPIRMAVMPRTELNLVTASRFNRARIQVTPRSILARTIEVAAPGRDAVEALYEFSPALELVRASYGDHYWELHRALEMLGTLRETRQQSPDRDGPIDIQTWNPQTGWATVRIR